MKGLTITRIGHSTVLIDFDGHAILTDPWFTEKTGYKRTAPLPMDVDSLPALAGVFVSHKHFDHCDMKAMARYPDKSVPFAVCQGVAPAVKKAGFTNVTELSAWQTASLGPVTVTATPASHAAEEITAVFSAGDFNVFFGGDSLFVPQMGEIPKKFPSMDLALVPVNGLCIRPLGGKKVVMNAQDAAGLCTVLNPRYAVPIHYEHSAGGFADKVVIRADGDPKEFAEAAKTLAPETTVKVLAPGTPLTIKPR